MSKIMKEWLANRALMLLVAVFIIGPSLLAMSGCAPIAVPVDGYYYQQPYYGYSGTQMPLGPSPMMELQRRNQIINQRRNYYGGGYYPAPQVGFDLQIQIQGGNRGYGHHGRHW